MHPDELATLKNTGNTSLTTVAIDTMNVHLLEKLIDVCQHKIITDLKKRFKVLIKNLINIVPESRANLITKLLEYNDYDIFTQLYQNFKDEYPFDTTTLIKKLLESNDYITIRNLYKEFKYDFIFDKIIERVKAKDADYAVYIEGLVVQQIPDTIISEDDVVKCNELMKIVKTHHDIYTYVVVGNIYRYLRQPYNYKIELLDKQKKHTQLPDNIDLQFSLYDPRVPECKELHISIMTYNKILFDYFFEHGYHLSDYTINLLDCIVAYEFELFTQSGLYKGLAEDPNDDIDEFGYRLFSFRFVDSDIYYTELDENMEKMVKDHPEAIDIMENIMFRDESIYYIMKLLNSPMSKKCNRFTKMMLNKFIVPFIESKLCDQIVCSIDDCEIETDDTDHKSSIAMDVMHQYQQYNCLLCNKSCYRTKHDLKKEVDIYTRTVKLESQFVSDAECSNSRKIPINSISFCSLKCQNEFV